MSQATGIALLGSTGSIGRSTLDVVRGLGDSHRVVALAAGRNAAALAEQMREFRPQVVSLAREEDAATLRDLARETGTRVLFGSEGASAVATATEVEVVVSGMVGSAGLLPTLAAVRSARTVALANKEVMVVAGAPIRAAAAETGALLLPVDSEHNALHQCLRAGGIDEVQRLVLTASGGPFWDRPEEDLDAVTPEQALNHPVWNMGPKISIDSATLMNKGLEVVEARWLFDLPPDRIDVVIHPGSVVHSLVEFRDGSIVAQMGTADMRHPIQYALTWPARQPAPVKRLDLTSMPPLRFHAPDSQRFPCLGLAYRALRAGGAMPAALNGANEALVQAFLDGNIRFNDIPRGIATVIDAAEAGNSPLVAGSTPSLEECMAADLWGREAALAALADRAGHTGSQTA